MLELWVVDFVSLPAHMVENRLLLDFGQVVPEPPLQQTLTRPALQTSIHVPVGLAAVTVEHLWRVKPVPCTNVSSGQAETQLTPPPEDAGVPPELDAASVVTPSPKHLPPLDVTPDKVACDKGKFLMGLYRYEACIGVYKPGKAVAARAGPEGGES